MAPLGFKLKILFTVHGDAPHVAALLLTVLFRKNGMFSARFWSTLYAAWLVSIPYPARTTVSPECGMVQANPNRGENRRGLVLTSLPFHPTANAATPSIAASF